MGIIDQEVALVVPCFNEATRFPNSYWEKLLRDEKTIAWLFVDDGSIDATGQTLEKLCEGTTARWMKLPKNLGKANAIRAGILELLEVNQNLKYVGYLDSDGAFGESDIRRLTSLMVSKGRLKTEEAFDAVVSSRVALAGRNVRRNLVRHYLGRVIATLLTRSWEDAPYDTQSGFKLFKISSSFQKVVEEPFKTNWFLDVEILTRIAIANKGRIRVWEEPLDEWRDVDGSRIDPKSSVKIFVELVHARRQVKILNQMRADNGFS